jgi:hypothetical protein
MKFDLEQWFNSVTEGTVLCAYRGTIYGDIITDILERIEDQFNKNGESPKIRKKIYNILVEALQNLFHHVDDVPEEYKEKFEKRFAVFILKKEGDSYKIIMLNFVRNDKIHFLRDRIDQINLLTKDELKALYKIILNNQEFSIKGGGGLGLIDIARRSGGKLEYYFFELNSEYSFFKLEVIV